MVPTENPAETEPDRDSGYSGYTCKCFHLSYHYFCIYIHYFIFDVVLLSILVLYIIIFNVVFFYASH